MVKPDGPSENRAAGHQALGSSTWPRHHRGTFTLHRSSVSKANTPLGPLGPCLPFIHRAMRIMHARVLASRPAKRHSNETKCSSSSTRRSSEMGRLECQCWTPPRAWRPKMPPKLDENGGWVLKFLPRERAGGARAFPAGMTTDPPTDRAHDGRAAGSLGISFVVSGSLLVGASSVAKSSPQTRL